MIGNQKGQALLETMLVAATSFISFIVLILMVYRGLVYFTARHSVNELLFCLASLTPKTQCEQEFQAKIKTFLIFKESSQTEVKKTRSQVSVRFKVFAPGTPALQIERKLLLPLKRNIQ